MAESGVTIPSDSEQYSGAEDLSMSPPSSSSPPLILYQPPTIWSLMRGAAINLFLPFINGMMLGFGELFAHEAAFRLGWGGTRVRYNPGCNAPHQAPDFPNYLSLRDIRNISNFLPGIPAIEATVTPNRPWNRGCGQAETDGVEPFNKLGVMGGRYKSSRINGII